MLVHGHFGDRRDRRLGDHLAGSVRHAHGEPAAVGEVGQIDDQRALHGRVGQVNPEFLVLAVCTEFQHGIQSGMGLSQQVEAVELDDEFIAGAKDLDFLLGANRRANEQGEQEKMPAPASSMFPCDNRTALEFHLSAPCRSPVGNSKQCATKCLSIAYGVASGERLATRF